MTLSPLKTSTQKSSNVLDNIVMFMKTLISLRAFVEIEGDEPQNSNFSKDIHHFRQHINNT